MMMMLGMSRWVSIHRIITISITIRWSVSVSVPIPSEATNTDNPISSIIPNPILSDDYTRVRWEHW